MVLIIIEDELVKSVWFVCGNLFFFIKLVWVVIVISVFVVLKNLINKNVKMMISICMEKIFGRWI